MTWTALQMNSRSILLHREAVPKNSDGLWFIVDAEDLERLPVAVVDYADDTDGPTRAEAANVARLIAAAPELLDRLKKLGMATRDGYCFCDPEKAPPSRHPEWCRLAAEAVSKAEGR